jgi:hypothetical protein
MIRLDQLCSGEQKFDGKVRAIVPLFETEIRGVPMLQRLSDALFV